MAIIVVHEPVASDFGNDAGSGNRIAPRISANQGRLRELNGCDPQAVHEDMLWRRRELSERSIHGVLSCAKDVDGIDGSNINDAEHATNFSVRHQDAEKALAFCRFQLFGVVQSSQFSRQTIADPHWRERDGSGHNWPSQGSTTGLIHPGDSGHPSLEQSSLK